MEKSHSNLLSRRNVIRSTAGLSSIGLTSLLASGTGAAASGTQGKYGYEIDDSGHLVYHGDDDTILDAVEGMNEAHDNGELDFAMENGVVMTQSQSQPVSGEMTTMSCAGKNQHKEYFKAGSIRNKFWIDHCNCNDIIDMLSTGVEVGVLSTTISTIYGNIPAALASALATFLMRVSKSLISNNDEGKGIVVAITTSYMGDRYKDGGGIEPQ
ncbi:hypothetical protein [Natrinema pallidum]|nr:hypothetical protein [Natrinema pallidum]